MDAAPTPPTPQDLRPPRYETLDAWRGIACLMVGGFHAAGAALDASHRSWPFEPLWWLERDAWLGVQIFFVVSGYSIASSAASSGPRGAPGARAGFLRRRFRRIFPTYWCAMVLVVAWGLVGRGLAAAGVPNTIDDETRIGWHWVTNLLLVEAPLATFGIPPRYGCGVIWSLCFEVQFYAFTALAIVARSRRTVVASVLGLSVATVLVRALPGLRPHGFLLDVWLEFAAGLWLFARLALRHAGRPTRGLDLAFAAAVAANVLAWRVGSGRLGTDGENVLFCAAVAAALLYLHPYDARLTQWIPVRVLRWVGDRSYSVYLLHLPVVRSLVPALRGIGLTRGAWAYGAVAAAAAASVGVATVFHAAVERRFLRPKAAAAPA